MKKVILTKGLPASGKTTWAKELQDNNPSRYKRINKDDLRAMFDNGKWSKDNEKKILEIRDLLILEALKAGKHVIVDDTNLHPKHEAHIRELVKGYRALVKVKEFDVPVEECIRRDAQRENPVGKKVIRGMYNSFLRPEAEVYSPPEGKPWAIIVDVDGTLAHMNNRSPYEGEKVGSDTVDDTIRDLVARYKQDHVVIVMTGRDGAYKELTESWLTNKHIEYDEIFTRAEGDTRNDAIIKRELFDNHVRDNYQVQFVLDDRNRVVEMWRDIGLKCLQVGEGDF